MRRSIILNSLALMIVLAVPAGPAARQTPPRPGEVPRFAVKPTDINLFRPAQPFTYFDKVGRKFALLGTESGSFEAWAYPLKILRNFEFAFLIGSSTVPVQGRDIVRFVSVDPAVTTLTFTYQSFTVRAHYVAAIDEPGAVILLEVDASEPLTVVCSFLPVLQPMWPAGLGGQYAYWDDTLKAYLISEPTRRNHGFVGSPAARGISYTPAHMLSDAPNQFKIEVADPKAAAGVFLPVVLAGGKGKREDIRAVYERIAASPEACYRAAVEHYRTLRGSTLRVEVPDRRVGLALEWAKVALDNLLVDNPDLGRGLVAGLGQSGTGGRPGFGWFFGGDAYLNSFSLNSLGDFEASRAALVFTRKWQRRDGKMAHELSQAAGYVDWWKDYPYGYIHGDTSPYYIVAVGDYFRKTGDLEFLRAGWPSVKRAFAWCLTTDADGDGLMDNARAGLGALEFGALTGIQTDIFLGAAWVKACQAFEEMAPAMGDKTALEAARGALAKALPAWNEKFWDAERKQYSYAFNKEGRLVPELTPWSAVGLAWALGSRDRGTETMARMNAPGLATDWGIRMLSDRSPLFEPLNYNYGAVWPFLTGWVGTALFEYGFVPQAFQVLMANVRHTFDNALGSVTELFSGYENVWPQEGVPHQGFSSTGVVLPLLRGLMGLDWSAPGKRVDFRPRIPAGWPGFKVSNLKVGGAVLALEQEREGAEVRLRVVSEGASGFRMRYGPALGLGTRILGAKLNGARLDYELETAPYAQSVEPRMEFALTGNDVVVLATAPAPEIVPPDVRTRTGDTDRGLKIRRTSLAGADLVFQVEGLGGMTYRLGLAHADRVEAASGARLDGPDLVIEFPEGNPGEFVGREVVLRLKAKEP